MAELNFVSPPVPSVEVSEEKKDQISRRRWPWILLGVIVLGVLMSAPLVYAGISAGQHAQRARASLERAYVQMAGRSFAAAQQSVTTSRGELLAARSAWRWVGPWGSFPGVSTHVQAFDQALEAGLVGLDAADQLLQAAARIEEAFASVSRVPGLDPGVAPHRSFRDLSRSEKRAVLARLDQALPEIRAAREKALIALSVWERIPQERMLPPVRQAMEPITRSLQAFRDRSDAAVNLMGLFLPMVGYPQPKTYIVLLQNADELRPTGGFIGTVGVVRLDSGEVTDQLFQDVYTYDRSASSTRLGPAPEPLRRELSVPAWYLRDSNWSPDVPQTAERVMRIFEQENWLSQSVSSVQVQVPDGVVFLEPNLFTSLLRFTGPITVDGVTFTPEGFFDQLQYAVEVGFAKQGIPVEERKRIVSRLGDALFARLSELPARQWMDVFDVALRAFAQKDVMLVLRDPALQQAFDARGWSGRAKSAPQDELWVVDTNLAALKTDGVMDKQVRYTVDMTSPGGPLATVQLSYTNTHRAITWRYTRYRDYVRIFVPEGSELVSSEGAMAKDLSQTGGRFVPGQVDVMKDLGKTVFGAFWSIEPGETRQLRFTYRLPLSIQDPIAQRGMYQLLVQKQPGAKHRLTLDLRFGKTLVTATPPEMSTEFGDDRYRVTKEIDQDTVFSVKVR